MNELFHEAMPERVRLDPDEPGFERQVVGFDADFNGTFIGAFGSLDEAKAAAQADYDARLRAALADAKAVGFAAGVEAAAKMADSFLMVQIGLDVERVLDCATAILALTPPDATAAAARVLLGVWPTDDSFRAAFDACVARYHGGDQMQDEMDRTRATVSAALRAMAGEPQ